MEQLSSVAMGQARKRLGELTTRLQRFERQLTTTARTTQATTNTVSKSLKKVSTSTRAVLTLLGFDEINRLKEKTTSSRSSGSSGKSKSTGSSKAGDKTKTGPSADYTPEGMPSLTRYGRDLGSSFFSQFRLGVQEADKGETGQGMIGSISSGFSKGLGDVKQWVRDHLWTPIKNGWSGLGDVSVDVGTRLTNPASALWETFRMAWGTPGVGIVNSLTAGAGTLWEIFRTGWGIRGVSIGNTLATGAGTLWENFRMAWGTRDVKIGDSLATAAGTLWERFRGSWGTRNVSITNSLTNSASTLWNNFKSGWTGKRLGLTVSYSTNVGALKKAVYKALGLAGWPSISFAARGGVFNSATLTMLGEAGTEAVVPLEHNTGWIDKMAQKLGEKMGGGTGTVVVPVYIGGEKVAEHVVRTINAATRATGVSPLYI